MFYNTSTNIDMQGMSITTTIAEEYSTLGCFSPLSELATDLKYLGHCRMQLIQETRYNYRLTENVSNPVQVAKDIQRVYSISQEICTRFCCALLCCGYATVLN